MTIFKNRVRAFALAVVGALLILPSERAHAQAAVITGKVTAENGQPVEAANLYINELAVSIGSNAAGNYTISIPSARVSVARRSTFVSAPSGTSRSSGSSRSWPVRRRRTSLFRAT